MTTPTLAPQTADIAKAMRILIGVAAIAMTALCTLAVARWFAGLAPDHPHIREIAIALHLSAVLPAVPLGGYVLLARKGDARHRMLGKVWLMLMVITALTAIFVQTSGTFSWIHVFVPTTLVTSWHVIRTARAGRIAQHRRAVVFLYITGLILPGLFTFLPGRLLGTWLLG